MGDGKHARIGQHRRHRPSPGRILTEQLMLRQSPSASAANVAQARPRACGPLVLDDRARVVSTNCGNMVSPNRSLPSTTLLPPRTSCRHSSRLSPIRTWGTSGHLQTLVPRRARALVGQAIPGLAWIIAPSRKQPWSANQPAPANSRQVRQHRGEPLQAVESSEAIESSDIESSEPMASPQHVASPQPMDKTRRNKDNRRNTWSRRSP